MPTPNDLGRFRDVFLSISCHGLIKARLFLLLIVSAIAPLSVADNLPRVTGVSFDGGIISWDALDGAIGYNVYRNFQYLATVTEGTEFRPSLTGEYQVAAFDGDGHFSPEGI